MIFSKLMFVIQNFIIVSSSIGYVASHVDTTKVGSQKVNTRSSKPIDVDSTELVLIDLALTSDFPNLIG